MVRKIDTDSSISEARNLIDAEWDVLYQINGEDLYDYLSDLVDGITLADTQELWMEFWCDSGDFIMRRTK